ncbi:hypothetical protein QJS10_CPB22g00408 [Acorus calamus]|uniref:Uncharacterized protein n=1 Tax=Acorus calamus TaxID=4465 RepID=A0AAV9C256_ACOCL|nr:hypothetical protein QJS10_CPB22g00408 [Acorus calamus]
MGGLATRQLPNICSSKVFVGLKPQSGGPFDLGRPNVTAEFHSRVHQSLNSSVVRDGGATTVVIADLVYC